jgi:two-component system phosphate regulon sensor histidine kinase PhoR
MSKRIITGLVLLMGISLLGIIAVQFHWFNNSVKVSNEQIDENRQPPVAYIPLKGKKRERL